MPMYYGHEYEVSVYVYLKVAMSKRKDQDEIEEEAFDATCRLYEHESHVEVVDNRTTEIEQSGKYFTVANQGLDLRIKVTAHDYDEACEEADNIARSIENELPAGVAWYDSEAYDAQVTGEAVDWDWGIEDMAVGE